MTSDEKADAERTLTMIVSDCGLRNFNADQVMVSVGALAIIVRTILHATPIDNDPDGSIERAAYEDAMSHSPGLDT